jgi:two-component system chemotaxis response regulator CheB
MTEPIRVLIVDDSSLVRTTLRELLESDPGIRVIGTAPDPVVAVEMMKAEAPDVLTLDIEMPRVDGLTFLEKIMEQHPLPVVICSSMAQTSSDNYLRALALGAVEIIPKPAVGTKRFLEESRVQFCDAVKAAAQAKLRLRVPPRKVDPKLSADAVLAPGRGREPFETTDKVIAIGASTGGTEALRRILPLFPQDCPGIVITQHMPELFTRSFAASLDRVCRIRVREAQDGEPILRGQALVAPGNRHLLVRRNGARYVAEVKEGPLVNRHRPSVDVLFRSVARYAGRNAVGVILTGMGDDGARGLVELRQAGARTVAQDEASSVVWGMPKVAIGLGGAEAVCDLDAVVDQVLAFLIPPR